VRAIVGNWKKWEKLVNRFLKKNNEDLKSCLVEIKKQKELEKIK
jgi:hypothetical protein